MEKRRQLLEEVDGGGWLVGQPDSAPLYRLFHSALALEMPSAAEEYCYNYLVACIYIYVCCFCCPSVDRRAERRSGYFLGHARFVTVSAKILRRKTKVADLPP